MHGFVLMINNYKPNWLKLNWECVLLIWIAKRTTFSSSGSELIRQDILSTGHWKLPKPTVNPFLITNQQVISFTTNPPPEQSNARGSNGRCRVTVGAVTVSPFPRVNRRLLWYTSRAHGQGWSNGGRSGWHTQTGHPHLSRFGAKLWVLYWGKQSIYLYNSCVLPPSLPPSDVTSFAGFFNYPSMRNLLDNFCVYHVNAPGQEEGAPAFPEE